MGSYLWQAAPGNAGKVVVLHVVAHIKGEVVEGSVVGVGLNACQVHVVLSDEVSRDWMETHTEDRASNQVNYWLGPPEPEKQRVKGQLHNYIQELQPGHRLWVDHQGTQGIEERLQDDPQHFAGGRAEEPGLEPGGDVHVQAVAAEVAVVVHVVLLEADRVRDTHGQVGEHSEKAVERGRLVAEGNVVGNVVDGQGQRVVYKSAEHVGPEEQPLPAESLHEEAAKQLGENHRRHHPTSAGGPGPSTP